ncbi:MAG TPA: exopolysaccharide biosynthesis polyprenyl glycosylphosphotransferase [Ruminiclostridium sp.]|nr:exopolysaccharide biosynthesis polyprenyl glycosylphosphotransferase [Ruminiclostridium sp.]
MSENEAAKIIYLTKENRRYIYYILKRLADILLSVLALVVLSPLFLITAIAIKFDSKGSTFYSQLRVGEKGRTFHMYKFRSMCADADKQLENLKSLNERDGPVFKIANDPRVTRVGHFIRRTSIDELPQLINIIKGDMSIVGPRPPLLNEVKQYTLYQMQRLSVKPGLTCYWQISGRSNISFDEWVELDRKYIKESSLWTDFKIIVRTVPAVLFGRGAY